MRVLLVSSREKGHLHPLLPVAERLVAGGHAVGWLLLPGPPAGFAPTGVALYALDEAFPPELVTAGPELAALVRDPDRLRPWIRHLLVEAVPAQVPRIADVLRAFRPDVVATDPMVYAAAIAADAAGVPWVGLSSSLNPVVPDAWDSELIRTTRALDPDRRALLPVPFRVSDALSPRGTSVWATGALVPARDGVRRLGPVRPATPPTATLPDRPFLYASFGSQISWQPEAFLTLASAARRLGLHPVFAAGALADDAAFRAEVGDATLLRDAPQRALLPAAEVFVSHGGANSVMEAIDAGAPLALAPVCNDQPHNARFAVEAGLAIDVGALLGDPVALADALGAWRADRTAQACRAAAQADYRGHDGAEAAVAWLREVG